MKIGIKALTHSMEEFIYPNVSALINLPYSSDFFNSRLHNRMWC